MLALPIFPDRRQSGIVGRDELNCRVRNGNGWTLILINTNCIIRHNPETVLHYIRFVLLCQAFFSISGKKFFLHPETILFHSTIHTEVFLTAGTQPETSFSSLKITFFHGAKNIYCEKSDYVRKIFTAEKICCSAVDTSENVVTRTGFEPMLTA